MSHASDLVATQDLRRRLREARLAQGYSQQFVADLIGRTQSAVSEWETGDCIPGLASTVRWARALVLELTLRPATEPS